MSCSRHESDTVNPWKPQKQVRLVIKCVSLHHTRQMHKIGLLPFTAWLMSDKRHSWCWHPPHSHPGSADIFSDLQLVQNLASSPISTTSLSSTTSSTSTTSPDFAQPCISYKLYNFYNLCATLHLLSALPFTSYTGRYIDALHTRSQYILRSWICSPDGQLWSDVLRQATFTAYLNKVVDCCWSLQE